MQTVIAPEKKVKNAVRIIIRKVGSILLMLAFVLGFSTHADATIWFGEENGHRLHRDHFCRNRSLNIPNPFEHTFDYEDAQAVYNSGEWLVCSNCYTDFFANSEESIPQSFNDIWNASLEEKSAMLPGVWTLPSDQAISAEEAYQTAKECAAANPELSRYLNANALCTVSVFHYDAASTHAMEQRETYKALITTPLREPIGVVLIDALSGEVYGVKDILYDDFENLYGKQP